MATASIRLSDEQLRCPICLDVFIEPVTTTCGHIFCKACILHCWDIRGICQCPMCKKIFTRRPELQVNTFISELTVNFLLNSAQVNPSVPGSGVLCDFCSETKLSAVKSCVICLTSLCETHLEPHRKFAGLKSHTLIDPVPGLEDRMCKKHSRVSELYCRTDQTCICVICLKTDHKSHRIVPLEEEKESKLVELPETMAKVKDMILEGLQRISEIERSTDASKKEAEREMAESMQVFTDLIHLLEKSRAELVEVIEERYKLGEQQAESFMKELKMEIAELDKKRSEVKELSCTEDHHGFVLLLSQLSALIKTKDQKHNTVERNLSVASLREAVSRLQVTFEQKMEELREEAKELRDVKLKRFKEYAVDVTFDPDTVHCELILSKDGKELRLGTKPQNLPDNKKRFEACTEVLSKEGFTSGRFYYEVQVKGSTHWILGVARESVERKKDCKLSIENGYWALWLDEDDGKYRANSKPVTKLSLREKPQKVGIFVDYDMGQVSFYDADLKSNVFTFTGQCFKERLYPYFCLDNVNTNCTPLIITPVHPPK